MEKIQYAPSLALKQFPRARFLILELLCDERNDNGFLYPREGEDIDVMTFVASAVRLYAGPESVSRRVFDMRRLGLAKAVIGDEHVNGVGRIVNLGITNAGEDYLGQIRERYPAQIKKVEEERMNHIDSETIALRHGELNHMRSIMGEPPILLRDAMPTKVIAAELAAEIELRANVLDANARAA